MSKDEERARSLLRRAAPDLGGVEVAPIVEHAAARRRVVLVAASVVLVAAVALGVGLWRAGPGGRGAAPAATSAAPVTEVDALVADVRCSPRLSGKGVSSDAAPGDALRRFHAVAVVACAMSEQRYPDGLWSVVRKRVAVTPLAPLVSGLLTQKFGVTGDGGCLAFRDGPPDMNLVAADGALLRPRFPTDECGHVRGTPAAVAYEKLRWRTVATTKLNLDVPNDPVRRTCGDSWKDMIALGPRDANSYSGQDQPLPLKSGTIACVYRVGDDPTVGRFEDGRRLTAPEIAALRSGLGGVGRPASCHAQTRFAVLHTGNRLDYVELGGCRRVLRDGVFGRATASAVATLLRP